MAERTDIQKPASAESDKSTDSDPEFNRRMSIAQEIMDHDREILRKLAKS